MALKTVKVLLPEWDKETKAKHAAYFVRNVMKTLRHIEARQEIHINEKTKDLVARDLLEVFDLATRGRCTAYVSQDHANFVARPQAWKTFLKKLRLRLVS